MGKYKTYEKYKPSGVEWLGEVPKHWDVTRLKFIAAINPEVLSESTDPEYEIKYVDIGNVSNQGEIEFQSLLFANAPSRARRRVIAGDVIISTVRTYLQAIAYFRSPELNTIVSTGFAVLRPRPEVDSKFLYYTISSRIFISHVMANSVGVSYPAINPKSLADLYTWLPPIAEQKQIARFLDHETTRIDTLITKKRQLIALLQKKRDAIIHQAVTKGLDPTFPLKKTRLSWVREIPQHWVAAPLYARYNVQLGKMLDQKQVTGKYLAPYLRNIDVQWDCINTNNLPKMDFDPQERQRFLLKKGDTAVPTPVRYSPIPETLAVQ
jgi:type I restriction enzyme S subunit